MTMITPIQQQWNQKYKFISDGTWFVEGTEAKLICWIADQPDISMPVQQLRKLQNVSGLFSGTRKCEQQYQLKIWPQGYFRQDEQVCSLDEFTIIPSEQQINLTYNIVDGLRQYIPKQFLGMTDQFWQKFDDWHEGKL